jgi:2'-5' RNA ligase
MVAHRLFIAVWPPADVLDLIERVPRPPVTGLRWTARDRWHVTLRFLGPVVDVMPVVAALGAVAGVDPPQARLGPAVGRFGGRVLHVPVRGLEPLAARVVAATATVGRPPEDRPFHGHITLARVANRARVDLWPLAGTAIEGGWDVDAVCLVESRPAPAGAHYEVLERIPLVGWPTPGAG